MTGKRLSGFTTLLIAILLISAPATSAPKLRIVTSLPDLADIARQIGGDRVKAVAIAKGYQDPHFVDPKPSAVLKLKRADIFAHVGLDLETGWVPPLLETARNRKVYYGGEGYVDASQNVTLLEVPTVNPADLRAQGDIHVFGNPHYWLDPLNGKIMARNIHEKMAQVAPDQADEFAANLAAFEARIDSAMAFWIERLAPYRGTPIVAYHNSWPYFAQRFGLEIAGFIEPKPGIPPTPGHLVSTIEMMKSRGVKVVIISPYFDDRPAKSIAKRTGATVVHMAASVGAFKQVKDYFDLFEYNVNLLAAAFKEAGVAPATNGK